jgi:hypothetical protein
MGLPTGTERSDILTRGLYGKFGFRVFSVFRGSMDLPESG